MADEARAVAGASVLHAVLDRQGLTAPDIWACGYLLHHRGRVAKDSFTQIKNTVSGLHQPRDSYGLEQRRTLVAVKKPRMLGVNRTHARQYGAHSLLS